MDPGECVRACKHVSMFVYLFIGIYIYISIGVSISVFVSDFLISRDLLASSHTLTHQILCSALIVFHKFHSSMGGRTSGSKAIPCKGSTAFTFLFILLWYAVPKATTTTTTNSINSRVQVLHAHTHRKYYYPDNHRTFQDTQNVTHGMDSRA